MTQSIEQQKRRIIIASRIAIIATIMIAILIPSAYASKDNGNVIAWIETITEGPFEAIYSTLHGNSIYASVTSADYINDHFAGAYNVLKIIALTWALIIATVRLFQNIEDGKDPVESTFKVLIEILVVGLILINVDAIVDIVIKIGNIIVEAFTVTAYNVPNGVTPEEMLDIVFKATSGGWTWRIEAYGILILPYACTAIIKVVAQFLIIQIVLEIGIRKIFLPLAIAEIYQEGLRSPGVRYLKRLISVFIKLAVCIAVTMVLQTVTATLISGQLQPGEKHVMDYLMSCVLVNFTAVGLMFKGSEIANDVLG